MEDKQSRSRSPAREPSRSRSRSRSPAPKNDEPMESNPGNNLYVANLSYSVNNTLLEEEFAKFGKVLKCNLIIDPVTQESRGFGFVTMEDSKDADEAIEALNCKEMGGRNIRVERAKRKQGHAKTPGQYLGPNVSRRDGRRDDRRGGGGYDRRDDRRGGGYDDRRDGGGYDRRDDRRGGGYDDRRGGHDDRRGGGGYEDRRGEHDDRRGGGGGYDDRRGGGSERRDDRREEQRERH